MSASFTFLLACGLQFDYALHGANALNGADSVAREGRHGNTNAYANGDVNKTNRSPSTTRRNQQQQQQRINDDHHFIDVRL